MWENLKQLEVSKQNNKEDRQVKYRGGKQASANTIQCIYISRSNRNKYKLLTINITKNGALLLKKTKDYFFAKMNDNSINIIRSAILAEA